MNKILSLAGMTQKQWLKIESRAGDHKSADQKHKSDERRETGGGIEEMREKGRRERGGKRGRGGKNKIKKGEGEQRIQIRLKLQTCHRN